MCSNFEPIKKFQSGWVGEHLGCELPNQDWKEHVFKSHLAPFIFIENGETKCELGHFGLIPPWVEPKKRSAYSQNTYNARTETVDIRNSYRSPWRNRQFGLVLADSFYEPLYDVSGKRSVPTAIYRSDKEPTAIASIWESFTDKVTGEVIRSFSMLTVNADLHPFMSRFHKPDEEKRSVVVVENGDLKKWVSATHAEAHKLLKLSPDNYLDADFSKIITPQQNLF